MRLFPEKDPGTSRLIEEPVAELRRSFRAAASKHEAHFSARRLMEQLTREPRFLTTVLRRHLLSPGALATLHYPVVSVKVESNPDFDLVLHCWIPNAERETDLTTKAIHHHGNLLLTSATLFGPGYEHWTFTPPRVVDATRELYAMERLEAGPHPLHHVAFVEAQVAHVPLYPESLTITLALWSSQHPTTWRDHLKRVPFLKRREGTLREAALQLGLTRFLDVKVVTYFDFYPVKDGFRGMRERQEFARGPNSDYLYSLFHVLQETGNEGLALLVREVLDAGAELDNRDIIERLLLDLRRGQPIAGRLSPGHLGIPHANFRRRDIERALAAATTNRRDRNAGQLASP